jgi:excisionase family DNA binding protein
MDFKSLMIMTTAEVADHLGVHPSTVYKLLRQHDIQAMKVGSDWRFNKHKLDKWMARKTLQPR